VTTRVLGEPSTPNRFGNCTLNRRFVQVKARGWTPFRVPTDPRRRKHELPARLCRGSRVFAIEREREHDTPFTAQEVALVLTLHCQEMSRETLLHGCGKHRHPILPSFATPNHDLVAIEVEIFDAELDTLLEPEARAVQQRHDEPHHAVNVCDEPAPDRTETPTRSTPDSASTH